MALACSLGPTRDELDRRHHRDHGWKLQGPHTIIAPQKSAMSLSDDEGGDQSPVFFLGRADVGLNGDAGMISD